MIVNMFYDWHWKEREDEWISEIDIISVIISFYNVHWMRERMGERMSERVRLESLFILKKARYKSLILYYYYHNYDKQSDTRIDLLERGRI